MAPLDSHGWVSIVELIFYAPYAISSVVVCARHGFTRSSGWVYLLVLCVIRIVGAICQLLTYHDSSIGLIKATLIIDSIGLTPLELATLGLLSRLTDQIDARSKTPGCFRLKHFRFIQILLVLGLILSIVGGTTAYNDSEGSITPASTSKAGIILLIVAFAALMLVLLASLGRLGAVRARERRLGLGVIIAAPFILVRLVYSALAVFLHNKDFNIYNGSVAIHVGMAVAEEFVVVFIYLFLGFHVNILRPESKDTSQTGPERNSTSL